MHMTLREWEGRGYPGRFTGHYFYCWRTPSILGPDDDAFQLVITSGDYKHPFKDKYADPTHMFLSFYGLRQYLGKRSDEIEGDVTVPDGETLEPDPKFARLLKMFADRVARHQQKNAPNTSQANRDDEGSSLKRDPLKPDGSPPADDL